MPSLFDKLNLKIPRTLHVLDAPSAFDAQLASVTDITIARQVSPGAHVESAIAFVTTQRRLDEVSEILVNAARGDAVLWIAYPKGTSKTYRCDFSRDTGWHALGAGGFECVRQVAIDEDWTAMRFRHVSYIKSFTRATERALSAAGKARTLDRVGTTGKSKRAAASSGTKGTQF